MSVRFPSLLVGSCLCSLVCLVAGSSQPLPATEKPPVKKCEPNVSKQEESIAKQIHQNTADKAKTQAAKSEEAASEKKPAQPTDGDDCAAKPTVSGCRTTTPHKLVCHPQRDRVWAALASLSVCNFHQTPLKVVASEFEKLHNVSVRFDTLALSKTNINIDTTKVTFESTKLPLAATLNMLLHPHKLVWVVQHDSIWITTFAQAEAEIAIESLSLEHCPALSPQDVAQAIKQTVSPSSWSPSGGGSLVIVGRKLIIRQNWWNLRLVTELLWQLQDETSAAL